MPVRNRMRRKRGLSGPAPKPAPKPVAKVAPTPVAKPAPKTDSGASKYGNQTRQQWWETRFPEVPILYRAQDRSLRDVRNFIFDKSFVFDQVISKKQLRGRTDDETIYKCCMFVIDSIKYVGDDVARSQPEFWQYPEDTLTRGTGDCEDGAILLKSLSMACGVPDWKVKVQAGNVKGGGHAYCTYIRDDDTQCILDWCYWPNRLPINKRPKFDDEPNYYEIWFSFNKDHAYAETKLTYANGKVIDTPVVTGPRQLGNKKISTIAEIRAARRKNLTK